MNEPLATRYVMYVGRRSQYSWPWMLVALVVGTIIFVIAMGTMNPKSITDSVFWMLMAFIWLLTAQRYFELRTFYRIIEQQNRRIAELESEKDSPQHTNSRSE